MKKMIFLSLFVLNFVNAKNRILIDTIDVVVFGDQSTDIITRSDIDRPGLDGSMRAQDDLIFESLLWQEGVRFKMVPDEQAVADRLQALQRENDLTKEGLDKIFLQGGYTPQEGKQQFARLQTVNTVMQFKVGDKIVVPERVIQSYYEENPEYEQAHYCLQKINIPYSDKISRDTQKKRLARAAKSGVRFNDNGWSSEFWIAQDEIAADKEFIHTMKVHGISPAQEGLYGLELFRLKDKKESRLLTLQERYNDILMLLRQPKSQLAITEVKQELTDQAAIVYLQEPEMKILG